MIMCGLSVTPKIPVKPVVSVADSLISHCMVLKLMNLHITYGAKRVTKVKDQ